MNDFEDTRLHAEPIEHEDGPTFDWVLSLIFAFIGACAVVFGALGLGWLVYVITRSFS